MKLERTFLLPALAVAFAASAFAQTSSKPAEALPDEPAATAAALTHPNGPTVVMDTSMGRITCQFFQKQAPKTVANFIALAEGTKDWTDPATNKVQHNKPFYDGTIFHRVIPNFMIQGGDPTGTGMGNPGYKFDDEFDPNLNFDVPGRLAMANSGPNTDGSQFFITELAYDSLDQHYTIFGQCDESSVQVVKTIARVQTGQNDKPVTPVVLKKVTIVPEGQALPPLPQLSTSASHNEDANVQTNEYDSMKPTGVAHILTLPSSVRIKMRVAYEAALDIDSLSSSDEFLAANQDAKRAIREASALSDSKDAKQVIGDIEVLRLTRETCRSCNTAGDFQRCHDVAMLWADRIRTELGLDRKPTPKK